MLDRLDPADRRVLDLRCQLVWATTWMADANDLVAPRLGLRSCPSSSSPTTTSPSARLHWKTAFLSRWAARAHICLARRRNHRHRPAMGSSPASGEGIATPRRPVHGPQRCRFRSDSSLAGNAIALHDRFNSQPPIARPWMLPVALCHGGRTSGARQLHQGSRRTGQACPDRTE